MENENPLNLLMDNWLPVMINDGSKDTIPMRELGCVDLTDVDCPRSDFRGALYQLMIGCLQTMFAPEDREEWVRYWKEPPSKDELEAAFAPYLKAFNVDTPIGEPAFMQDLEMNDGEDKDISKLFIEAPGGKTLKDNQDHFIKRDGLQHLSPEMAVLALFTMQINAPAGGVGHRVSLRGGGPLTTLLLPPDQDGFKALWHRLWLNILTREELYKVPGNSEETDLASIFPWMAATRTSEKKVWKPTQNTLIRCKPIGPCPAVFV